LSKDLDNSLLDYHEKSYIDKLIHSRWDFIYGDAHGIAYLLDPRYMGDGMSLNLKDELEEFIWSYYSLGAEVANEKVKESMFNQYHEFQVTVLKLRESSKSYMYQRLMAGTHKVLDWWAVKDKWPELRKLAMRIFSLVPSGAESERNFSTEGFIHTKLRNRLSADKVAKLNAIKTNAHAFRNYECVNVVDDIDDIDDIEDHETIDSDTEKTI
jgi:hypothetical protein